MAVVDKPLTFLLPAEICDGTKLATMMMTTTTTSTTTMMLMPDKISNDLFDIIVSSNFLKIHKMTKHSFKKCNITKMLLEFVNQTLCY